MLLSGMPEDEDVWNLITNSCFRKGMKGEDTMEVGMLEQCCEVEGEAWTITMTVLLVKILLSNCYYMTSVFIVCKSHYKCSWCYQIDPSPPPQSVFIVCKSHYKYSWCYQIDPPPPPLLNSCHRSCHKLWNLHL